jgi:hypothetical protein
MATKKHKKKSTTRRRRHHRMGAVNLQSVGMKVAGIAVSAFADNLARKNFTSLSPKVLAAVEVVAGVMIPKFIKSPLGEGLSDGLIAVGTIGLLKQFNVISGVGATPIAARVPLRRNAIGPNAPSIGAAGRAYLNENVGEMPYMDEEMMTMGALLYED